MCVWKYSKYAVIAVPEDVRFSKRCHCWQENVLVYIDSVCSLM